MSTTEYAKYDQNKLIPCEAAVVKDVATPVTRGGVLHDSYPTAPRSYFTAPRCYFIASDFCLIGTIDISYINIYHVSSNMLSAHAMCVMRKAQSFELIRSGGAAIAA